MSLAAILVFVLYSLLVAWLLPRRWRSWALLAGSVLAVYWLQPSTPVRGLDFWLPTTSLALTVFVWAVTQSGRIGDRRLTLVAAGIVVGLVLILGLSRYAGPLCCLTPTSPPALWRIILFLALAGLAASLPCRFLRHDRFWPAASIVLILGLFVMVKTEPLALAASGWLRSLSGQSTELASALDLPWLGFSYLAFRLLHVLRDFQAGRLPAYTLSEFVTYGIFFPAYTAGPIDRSQHFIGELQRVASPGQDADSVQRAEDTIAGAWRILLGVFKKFVLADSLALIALNPVNAEQTTSTLWMWALLYAYALRIYFDFAGYTDIALGLARLLGIRLPENFERPYLKTNLTAFWNSWHITLAQWFRAYFFNPLTRALRTRPQKLPAWLVILVGQFTTMLLIGLWHGVTWNFAIWGGWHGLGLFVHNRWSGWIRPRLAGVENRTRLGRFLQVAGWFATFNYVTLGWVWFALPTPGLALDVFQKLGGF